MNSSSRSKGSNRSSPRLCPPPRHGGGGRFGSKKINLSNLLMLSNSNLCVAMCRVWVLEYVAADGRSPYAKWFNSLNAQAAAKVTITVTRMAQGNFSRTPKA